MQLSLFTYSFDLHTYIPRHWNMHNSERSCCWETVSWVIVPMQFVLFFPLFASVPRWLCNTLIKNEGVFKETHSKLYLNSLSVSLTFSPLEILVVLAQIWIAPKCSCSQASRKCLPCGGSTNNLRESLTHMRTSHTEVSEQKGVAVLLSALCAFGQGESVQPPCPPMKS